MTTEGTDSYDKKNLFYDNPSRDTDYGGTFSRQEKQAILGQLAQAQAKGVTIKRMHGSLVKTDKGDVLEVRSRTFPDIDQLAKEIIFQFHDKPLYLHSFDAGFSYELPEELDFSKLVYGEVIYGDEDEFIKRCKKVRSYVMRYAA